MYMEIPIAMDKLWVNIYKWPQKHVIFTVIPRSGLVGLQVAAQASLAAMWTWHVWFRNWHQPAVDRNINYF